VRRACYWAAVLLALGALVAGGLYAYVSYSATSGPDGTVRGYFAALERNDAASALGFGDVPIGPTALLTDQVLAEQHAVAPMHDATVDGVVESGDTARVSFSYLLHFPDGDQQYRGVVRLVRRSGGWRLAATAVAVRLTIPQADDRFTFAGTSAPQGLVLMFPGALPVRFDTSYLQLDPSTRSVQFAGAQRIDVRIEPTLAGRRLLAARVSAQLRDCVRSARPAAGCPVPSPRTVPGSMHGRLTGIQCTYRVTSEASGVVSITGNAFFVGRYRSLTYDNIVISHSGRLALPVTALAYPVAPVTVRFTGGT
jgi:hypothetical protein